MSGQFDELVPADELVQYGTLDANLIHQIMHRNNIGRPISSPYTLYVLYAS